MKPPCPSWSGRAAGWLLPLLWAAAPVRADVYDPLAVPAAREPVIHDLTVEDSSRDREIPIRVFLPGQPDPAPVILFSHGLGGSREGNGYLGHHWSARGFAVVFLQHHGSDEAVWQEAEPARRMAAMRQAANLRNWLDRTGDVPAVLERLEQWHDEQDHPLQGRLKPGQVGMSGHSFGARTTQALAGEHNQRGRAVFADPRIAAALVLSPSSPARGNPAASFGEVRLPWMLMTGTHDLAEIGGADMESRLAVFPALPPGGKYELVLDRAEHSAFTDRPLPGDRLERNPNHHRAILALSTAFWEAFLTNDTAAREWLDGDGPRSVLDDADRWQRK